MSSSFSWHGPQIKAQIEAESKRRVAAMAVVVLNQVRRDISVPGTSQRISRGQRREVRDSVTRHYAAGAFQTTVGTGNFRRAAKKSTVYGSAVSAPGEPPRKQRGTLRASYAWEIVNGRIARVGSNYKVARHLELGTRSMAARPHLRPALAKSVPALRLIWSRPMKLR